VSEIAWLLGFKEVSAFTHAFRRWTGQTPTQARLDRRQAEVGRETWDVGL
jgi:AraC-like DNA-binding protein